ncbi:hypothetical protein [Myroides odoratus]|uniref:hypothetical protein n=1 Tax=Myroides odoratus TaxID=256 RepID=UPI00333E87D7
MDLKYNMIIGLFLISLLSYAQKTGIGTTDPLSDLHVNGDVSIASSIHVGATATAKGSAGNTGEVLVSKGAGNSPQWTNLDNILSPSVYQVQQTNSIFLPSGFNKPWLAVPNLTKTITIPKGKKAMVTLVSQICVQQTKNILNLAGVSSGIFKNNAILISNTSQIIHSSGFVEEFIIIPLTYIEFIDATAQEVQVKYEIKARSNYSNAAIGDEDLRVINNPFSRGDYSSLNISILVF